MDGRTSRVLHDELMLLILLYIFRTGYEKQDWRYYLFTVVLLLYEYAHHICYGKQRALSYLVSAKRLRAPHGRWCGASHPSKRTLAGCRRWPLWWAESVRRGTSRCARTCRYSGANALLTGGRHNTNARPQDRPINTQYIDIKGQIIDADCPRK